MFTFLDLLIVVSMGLMAASALALALMFLLKNKTAQRVCLYVVAALGVYIGTVGFRINWLGFEFQAGLAIALAVVSVGAVVLERLKKNDEKLFLLSRLLATGALALGMVNAFLV